MKKFLFCCGIFVFLAGVLQPFAEPAQLGIIVLNASELAAGSLPQGWRLKVNHGRPDLQACGGQEAGCIHMKSVKSSFALERGLSINPAQYPLLAWRWKVTQLPQGGDFRRAAVDDQAAQVLVAFADNHVLSYIWDSTAPQGLLQSASSIPLVHIFAMVCRSGAAELNRWVDEAHNVAADYEKAYGKPAPAVKGLRLQINSQHTGSTAESYFGEVAFRAAQ